MSAEVPGPTGSDPAGRAARARSFGPAAALYDAVRPTYPADALTWALGSRPRRLADVGAGTGLLTRVLLGLGHEVVAVEPDDQMAAALAARTPTVQVLVGRAESLPLADASVDAVVCGQAYHWFDPSTALPELRRVLRPGGVLVALWNVRDAREPWVAALEEVIGAENSELPERWPFGPVDPWFCPPERHVVDHVVELTPDGVLDLVRSRSTWLTGDAAERARLTERTRRLLAEHPDLAGAEVVRLPYRTCTYRVTPA